MRLTNPFTENVVPAATVTARQPSTRGPSIFGSVLSGGLQLVQDFFNRRWNAKQQDIAYDRNLAMWHRQNQYNTPQAQKLRLLAAGLNPALMYGNGSASTGNSSSTPVAQASQFSPSASMGQISNQAFSNAIQAGLARSQVYAQKVTNRYTHAQTESAYQAIENARLDGEVKRLVMPYVEQYEASKIASNYSTIGLNNARVNQINAEIERLLPARLRLLNASASQVRTSIREMEATIERIGLQNHLSQMQIDFFKADKIFHYITDGLGTVFDGVSTFVKPFSFGGRGKSPFGSTTTYRYPNGPFYSNEF